MIYRSVCIRYHTLSWLIEHDKAPSKVFELSLFGWCETTPGYLCGWSCQWWNQPRQQSSHEQIHDAVRWRCTRGEISSNDLFIWLESCERRLSTCRVNWMRSPSCWFVFPWEKKHVDCWSLFEHVRMKRKKHTSIVQQSCHPAPGVCIDSPRSFVRRFGKSTGPMRCQCNLLDGGRRWISTAGKGAAVGTLWQVASGDGS